MLKKVFDWFFNLPVGCIAVIIGYTLIKIGVIVWLVLDAWA